MGSLFGEGTGSVIYSAVWGAKVRGAPPYFAIRARAEIDLGIFM